MQDVSNAFAKSISTEEQLTDQQLFSLCQYFGIPTERFLSSVRRYFGKPSLRTSEVLRTELKSHMQEIIKYDEVCQLVVKLIALLVNQFLLTLVKAIQADGFETLPASKITALSKIRGIYSSDLEEIKQKLRIWLALSQQARLPLHMLALCSTIFAAQSLVPSRV